MDTTKLPFTASVAETVKWSGVSRTKLYELIGAGEINAWKAGATTLVETASVVRWIESLPSARGTTVRPAGHPDNE